MSMWQWQEVQEVSWGLIFVVALYKINSMGEYSMEGIDWKASWKKAFNTARGLDDPYDSYPKMLGFENKAVFLEWIKDKTVLDLGSGYGVIARDVKLEEEKTGANYNTKIVSLNPTFSKEGFRGIADKEAREYFTYTGRLPPPSNSDENKELVRTINDAHSQNAVAGTWNNLPFVDNAFDRVMATYSFPYYELTWKSKKAGEQKLLEIVQEVKRVLKPGGEARFYPVLPPLLDSSSADKKSIEPYLVNLIRRDSTLECRVVIPNQPDSRECVIMTKSQTEIKKSDI